MGEPHAGLECTDGTIVGANAPHPACRTTQLILASVNLYYPDYLPKPWHTVLSCWALIIVVGTIAILGQKALPKVDGFMIIWITAGVIATAVTLPVKAAMGTRSAAEVFT